MINNSSKNLLKNKNQKTLVIKRNFSSFSNKNTITKRIPLIKNMDYEKIIKRNMLTMLNFAGTKCTKVSHSVLPQIQNASMSSVKNIRFKKNSPAAKDLSADNSGNHIHRVTEKCDQSFCEQQKCTNICSVLEEVKTEGHYTHGPHPGKFSRFLSAEDAKGNKKSQYYTKNCDKTKKISGQKAQQYYQNNQIKNDRDMDNYVSKKEISSKFDD